MSGPSAALMLEMACALDYELSSEQGMHLPTMAKQWGCDQKTVRRNLQTLCKFLGVYAIFSTKTKRWKWPRGTKPAFTMNLDDLRHGSVNDARQHGIRLRAARRSQQERNRVLRRKQRANQEGGQD